MFPYLYFISHIQVLLSLLPLPRFTLWGFFACSSIHNCELSGRAWWQLSNSNSYQEAVYLKMTQQQTSQWSRFAIKISLQNRHYIGSVCELEKVPSWNRNSYKMNGLTNWTFSQAKVKLPLLFDKISCTRVHSFSHKAGSRFRQFSSSLAGCFCAVPKLNNCT